jgi:hypothetical protein
VLGLSLTKILFTILIILAVWRAFALLNRLQARQREQVGTARRGREPSRGDRRSPGPPVVDMVECPGCGAYVPRGRACGCGRRV